jgi:hypothetical protein
MPVVPHIPPPQVNECAVRGDTWKLVTRVIKRHKRLEKVGQGQAEGGGSRGTGGASAESNRANRFDLKRLTPAEEAEESHPIDAYQWIPTRRTVRYLDRGVRAYPALPRCR